MSRGAGSAFGPRLEPHVATLAGQEMSAEQIGSHFGWESTTKRLSCFFRTDSGSDFDSPGSTILTTVETLGSPGGTGVSPSRADRVPAAPFGALVARGAFMTPRVTRPGQGYLLKSP